MNLSDILHRRFGGMGKISSYFFRILLKDWCKSHPSSFLQSNSEGPGFYSYKRTSSVRVYEIRNIYDFRRKNFLPFVANIAFQSI